MSEKIIDKQIRKYQNPQIGIKKTLGMHSFIYLFLVGLEM